MSAERQRRMRRAGIAALFGLLAGAVAAEDAGSPDLALLEYLGSWDTSDEDWELFAETEATPAPGEGEAATETGQAPDGERLAEHDDEN